MRLPRLQLPARGRAALGLAAMTAAAFAVHAVPARDPGTVDGAVALRSAPAQRLAFALPAGWAPVPGRADAWQVVDDDGLAVCRSVLTVAAEATARGIRFEPAARLLAFRFAGRRRELRVEAALEGAGRRAFRGPVERSAVGARPVEAVLRFGSPEGSGLPPAVLVRTTVETFADTTSAVQRTPGALARCSRRTRAEVPPALDALEATAQVARAR